MQQHVTPENYRIERAEGQGAIAACFPIICQLRPYLTDLSAWTERAASLIANGYEILAVWENDAVVAMAGYRTGDNMIYGKFLYIDDLITDKSKRGSGLGARLLHHLQVWGQQEGCHYLVLDTAATNVEARRFYARQGLMDLAVGYIKPLDEQSAKNLQQHAAKV